MKTFTQYIKEKALPASTNLSDVRHDLFSNASGLPELSVAERRFWATYINHLSHWILGATSASSGNFLLKHRDKIPSKHRQGGVYYRGIGLSETAIRSLLKKGIKSKKGRKYESWTKDKKIAKRIAVNTYDTFTLVMKATIPSNAVVLDVESFVKDRETVKLGAAALKDNFKGMHFMEGLEREKEIIANTAKLDVVPFDASHIVDIRWERRRHNALSLKELWLVVTWLQRKDALAGTRIIRDWMKKHGESPTSLDKWHNFVTS